VAPVAAVCHPHPVGRPEGPSAERLTGVVLALSGVCARVPMLISVHDPRVGRRHDVDGVPAGGSSDAAARSLEAVHASVAAAGCGELAAVHRLTWGLARTGEMSCRLERLLAELPERVVAAFEQLAREREARAVMPEALGCLQVVVAVRGAGAGRGLRCLV
jgi:hypothetical protein